MGISKKNKSRVSINGKQYLWWVFDENDQTEFDGIQIKAVSADQTHFLKYGLKQAENNRKVVLALRDYTKLVHLSCPYKFENENGIITKSGITKMLEWCQDGGHQIRYAVNGQNNELINAEKQLILKELQNRIS